jgi:hypothetical protein
MNESIIKEVTEYCNKVLGINDDNFKIELVSSTREKSGNYCLYITTNKIFQKNEIRNTFINLSFVNKLHRYTRTKFINDLFKYTIVFKAN